jgi:hypothetical protein
MDLYTTIEKLIEQAKARGIYSEHELYVLWPTFLKENLSKRINPECQKKHIVGTKTFENYNRVSKTKGFAGAAYFDFNIDVYKIVQQSIGTGLVVFDKTGKIKEEIVKFSNDIGFAGCEELVRTNVISIRYAKKGIHATPVHPIKYEDTINFLKSR